jgi:hypothetical protein
MPTIIRQDGFRVVIYPNDHTPSHVHVIKNNGEVRINLGSIDIESGETLISPSLISVAGTISDKEVVKALALVKKFQAQLLDKWSEVHNE